MGGFITNLVISDISQVQAKNSSYYYQSGGSGILSLPDVVMQPGELQVFPLTLDLNNAMVEGVDIHISYDPNIASVVSVEVGELVPNDWILGVNLNTPGLIIVSLGGPTSILTSGNLLLLTFQAEGNEGSSSQMVFTKGELDEGLVSAILQDGNLTIADTIPPVLFMPETITVEAEGMVGAAITYTVTATDIVDPNPIVSCTPVSGVIFPLGITAVNCIATDASGNDANGSFDVMVVDTIAPVLTVPEPITVEAESMAGTAIIYTVTATDTVDSNPVINCTPTSGTVFALGTTVVDCTATDNNGNSANSSFNVTVVDTTAPALIVPEPITVEAESMVGTAVSYVVTATDIVDPNPGINCTPVSGDVFPIGITLVMCTTTDSSDNSTTDSFNITVVDMPPVLTMPEPITIEAESMAGTVVTYIVTATDTIDANPVINCDPASGTTFSIGTTVVNCTATDGRGNIVNGNFNVTVVDTTAPVLTVPEAITVEAISPAGTTVNYIVTATDIVDPNPNIVCIPESGTIFPLGKTTVNCKATDTSNNSSNSSFSVTIIKSGYYIYLPLIVSVSS